jgi:hypothetical protein
MGLTNVRFEVLMVVTMKNGIFWDVSHAALVSEELSASIIRVTRIGELGTLAVSNS